MNAATLKAAAQSQRLNQADLARCCGVTRQRVSQWFLEAGADGFIDAKVSSVKALAEALGLSADELLQPLPILGDPTAKARLTALLLWDQIYPDLISLFCAALNHEPAALARMVQGLGLYASAHLIGPPVWSRFPAYKQHLQPTLRRGLENVWTLRQNLKKA